MSYGISTVVDPLPHYPKVDGLSPAMAAGTEREDSEKVEEPTLLKLIKRTSEACTVKKFQFWAAIVAQC
jgi:hypothetical protein